MSENLPKNEDINIKIYKQVLDGTLPKFPRNFWKEEYESAPAIVRYLIEDVLKWSGEDIKENFSIKVLEDHKLSGLLKYVYNKIIFDVIEDAYPFRFYPWELKSVPNKYWHDVQNCIYATRWLIIEKLKWTREDIALYFNKTVFVENNMTGLLKWGWNGETLKAITLSFPEYNFKPWELLCVPLNNFSKEEAILAIRWFIEEKKQWDDADIFKNWRTRTLIDDGIFRIVKTVFDNSMFNAINSVYPNRFKPWEFPVPNNFWTLEIAKEALIWLVTEKLNIEPKDALNKVSYKDIYRYNLIGMLELGFKSSLNNALKTTFH